MEQRKIIERDRCEIEADIVLPETGVRYPCLVIDISEQGARLEVAADVALPLLFDLALPGADEIVDLRAAEVRWRRENAIGLLFVSR